MEYKLGGHIPDPDDENSLRAYWNFESQLRLHLAPVPGMPICDRMPLSVITRGKLALV